MNFGDIADAYIFLVLACVDLCFLVRLRRRRQRDVRTRRMMKILQLHVRRQITAG